MRLSQYAKHMNIGYKTAYRWYKAGLLDTYQLPTRTIIVREPVEKQSASKIALYARVGTAPLTGERAQATLRGRPRGRLGTVGSGEGRMRGRPRRLGSTQGAGATL